MSSTKKIESLLQAFKDGFRPVVVINEKIFEDCYLEKGMLARLTKVAIEEEGTPDQHIQYSFDYNDFMETNKQFESPNYYNKSNGNYDITATQADYRHGDGIESSYHEMNDDEMPFEILDNPLFEEYLNSESKDSYVSWLENIVKESRK